MGDCTCAVAGYCARFQRLVTEREREFCSGECPPERPCTPEQRALFAAVAQGTRRPLEFQPGGSGGYTPLSCTRSSPLSPLRRAWTFLRALVRHLRDRCQHVPAAVFRQRLATCRVCPEFRERPLSAPSSWSDWLLRWVMREDDVARSCGKCGCRGLKLRFVGETCPLGKWQSLDLVEAAKTSGG